MSDIFAIPWTRACQAHLTMGFSSKKYWSGLLLPSPGDLSDPGIELVSPALVGKFFTTEPPEKPSVSFIYIEKMFASRKD